jgi:molybdopterin synthase catalytic subunit
MTTGDVVHAAVAATPITPEEAYAGVDSPLCGAVVGFSGVVRNHDGGKPVDRLSYSAHPTAHQVMADVVARLVAEQQASGTGTDTPPVRIWAAHRIGMLEIGDPALVCAVSAAHRGQAFAVCSELVDRIKEQVPIWKEQFFSDGTVEWVGAGS